MCLSWNIHPGTMHHCHLIYHEHRTHPGGGTGVTLIFSYIRRLGHFLGFKILNFNMFLVFRKIIIFFLDMKILWIIF